ncbi:Iron siderophore binding protein [Corynebacterium kutscheri]|uniref:ABC-type Fe3+-hydroxamate transport system, periplasmic component n=1 Tax=Corynebacterium kutscheri TaxID=35755 RepID=A0A0F6TE58_9CORY|nr:iron-siderophore ABC transporter substrate-binding protein [Corynebacterium kutscheri]AKE41784.1 ABC-type Fe3+-hydroxamate transport system, periplasmic component [Corynebacterium kutscheri]VEH09059.1 Iron siderophore binding protein [Corynebacterium kutscheri]VEH10110.1 Iron siderophore binding protein [Corynebacterium kutscheri]VEH80192.1 Iron siderophore binding protein [Corynebacterium kutscheri]
MNDIRSLNTWSHRIAVVLALFVSFSLVFVLTACVSENNSTNDAGQGNTDVATGGAHFSTADEETAQLGSDAAPGEFPRTVKHALGETELKEQPKRVVVLDTGELDSVLSLGITPVGMVTTKGANPVPSYLADQVKDVQSVGTINEINVEEIAALQPDLILGSKLRADKIYAQLSEIAPTVFSIRPGFPWKENFLLTGEALGKEKEAEAKLNEYAAKVDSIKDTVPEDITVSLVRFMPERIRLYANKSLIGVILKDAGIARPANQDIDELAAEISPETIDEAEGSVIFYSSYGKPDATGQDAIVNGAAWKNLSAVKNGQAYEVNDDVWFLGLGPTGAMQIVDDLEEMLPKK